jgi:cellulose synthase/poly-beta-1,6-N-acetylglucosamine synthase-like glycosyltransferase
LPDNPLALLQTVEYMRAFLMARLAWSRLETLTIISGAFGLFRRDAVVEAGGYTRGLVGEDMELVVRLHRFSRDAGRDYRIAFVPEPVCWTEAPETLQALSRQRRRWQRGSLETFAIHKAMLCNPRYGRVGTVGLGGMLLIDVLGPLAEIAGYALIPGFYLLGVLSIDYLLAFLAVSFVFGVAISVGSLVLEEQQLRRATHARDLAILTAAAVLENFGYRQLNSVWRLIGWWEWMRGGHAWGEMRRKGFSSA